MATTPHHEPAASAPIAGTPDAGVQLLPLASETPAEYLARLKTLHARVGALIDTIESRRPVLGPVPAHPPRAAADRRVSERVERRSQVEDRRAGLPDTRPVAINRRFGPRDRRKAAGLERREDHIERRRDPSPVPWQGRLRFDRTAMVWVFQVVAWVAVAAVALIYGIGR